MKRGIYRAYREGVVFLSCDSEHPSTTWKRIRELTRVTTQEELRNLGWVVLCEQPRPGPIVQQFDPPTPLQEKPAIQQSGVREFLKRWFG